MGDLKHSSQSWRGGQISFLRLTSVFALRSRLNTISFVRLAGPLVSLALLSGLVYWTVPVMALQGLGRRLPYSKAEALTRTAAEAVLARSGSEDCLRGKLSNALLDLANSCQSEGRSSSLCSLADDVAAREAEFSLAEMTSTATNLLQIMEHSPSIHR